MLCHNNGPKSRRILHIPSNGHVNRSVVTKLHLEMVISRCSDRMLVKESTNMVGLDIKFSIDLLMVLLDKQGI